MTKYQLEDKKSQESLVDGTLRQRLIMKTIRESAKNIEAD